MNVVFVAAMGEPGGGRTFITPRILRHLNLVSLASFDDDALMRIFQTILHWHFSTKGFEAEVEKTQNKIVYSTLDIYNKVYILLILL